MRLPHRGPKVARARKTRKSKVWPRRSALLLIHPQAKCLWYFCSRDLYRVDHLRAGYCSSQCVDDDAAAERNRRHRPNSEARAWTR